jgi:hypothetical protein
MNIAQALKEKNRIAGRIVNLQKLIEKYNRYHSNETPVENVSDLWEKLLDEKASLINLKAKIQRANGCIADELVGLAEAKAMLTYLTQLENISGVNGKTEQVYDRKTGAYITSDYTLEHCFDIKSVRSKIEFYQKSVEDLQDVVDNYNATTTV